MTTEKEQYHKDIVMSIVFALIFVALYLMGERVCYVFLGIFIYCIVGVLYYIVSEYIAKVKWERYVENEFNKDKW